MPTRNASAIWRGNLQKGGGSVRLGSGAFEGSYSFLSRFQDGVGTNPEELIGAAHAGCFSMALAHALSEVGYIPDKVETQAKVHLEKDDRGFKISRIELICKAVVANIDEATFKQHADQAKSGCPVSRALAGVEIILDASLG